MVFWLMKPAANLKEIVPGLWAWSSLHEEWNVDFCFKIHVHRDAVPGIEIRPDEFFCDGAVLPGGLTAVHLPGTCPSETAFHTAVRGGIVLLGDALMNTSQGLIFLPDDYCKDPRQNRESVRRLRGLAFETLTFAHGNPIVQAAKAKVQALFSEG